MRGPVFALKDKYLVQPCWLSVYVFLLLVFHSLLRVTGFSQINYPFLWSNYRFVLQAVLSARLSLLIFAQPHQVFFQTLTFALKFTRWPLFFPTLSLDLLPGSFLETNLCLGCSSPVLPASGRWYYLVQLVGGRSLIWFSRPSARYTSCVALRSRPLTFSFNPSGFRFQWFIAWAHYFHRSPSTLVSPWGARFLLELSYARLLLD